MKSRWLASALIVLVMVAGARTKNAAGTQLPIQQPPQEPWNLIAGNLQQQNVVLWQSLLLDKGPAYGLLLTYEPSDNEVLVEATLVERNGATCTHTIYRLDRRDLWMTDERTEIANLTDAMRSTYEMALIWQARGWLKTKEQNDFLPTEGDKNLLSNFTSLLHRSDDGQIAGLTATITVDNGKKYVVVTAPFTVGSTIEYPLLGHFPVTDLMNPSTTDIDLMSVVDKAIRYSLKLGGGHSYSLPSSNRGLLTSWGGLYFLHKIT